MTAAATLLTTFGFYAATVANPLTPDPRGPIITTFEGQTFAPGVGPVFPVGKLDGLDFGETFNYQMPGQISIFDQTLIGLKPQSGRYTAGFGLVSETTRGIPTITADYKQDIACFDLQEMYLGCFLNLIQSVVALPVSCNIIATPYDAYGNAKTPQTLRYDPSTASGVSILGIKTATKLVRQQFVDEQWRCVSSVELRFENEVGMTGLSATIDDVKHKNIYG